MVDNYEELYPPGRWKDTTTYVKSSDTVEESISHALANGFLYYMDERDKEWLDKKNEEARGEGTSAQGALSGTSTRSARSAKAKGKEPDVTQPIAMSEDEFELVMAIFEKVTHEKTEFLHHVSPCVIMFPANFSCSYCVNIGSRARRAVSSVLRLPRCVRDATTALDVCPFHCAELGTPTTSSRTFGSCSISILARATAGT